jgi:glyoxylase-like metal-dependent hydrolase (beta-lactamase superfamily II)
MDTQPLLTGRLEPTEIATDTFVVHSHCTDGLGLFVPSNTLVIRSKQPVVVDTGMARHRAQFLHDVFSLVEPGDIGWIIVSHDDIDHTGNLTALVQAAANATVVVDRRLRPQLEPLLGLPSERLRWIDDGPRIDIGDRTLSTVRPHVFDSPGTLGLFDPTTGVYWAVDAFGTPLGSVVGNVAELEPDEWLAGMAAFDQGTAPWIELADEREFQSSVDTIEGIGASVIAGSHTPVIGRHHVHDALAAARRLTSVPRPDDALIQGIRHLLCG